MNNIMPNKTYITITDGDVQINKEWLDKYRAFKALQLQMELAEKEFKEELKEAMENMGKTFVACDGFSATVRKGSKRVTLDTKRLKDELPDIFDEYSKTTETKSSIVVTVE